MTRILAIDTSSRACSVALSVAGEMTERFEVIPKLHAQKILPMIDSVLAEAAIDPAQLDAIAFSRGPGSFTGIRIAAGVAQGLAFGADLPLVPVSTLAVLAQTVLRRHGERNIIPVLDAHMNEVYWGCYQTRGKLVEAVFEDGIGKPETLCSEMVFGEEQHWCGAGDGWKMVERFPDRLRRMAANCYESCYPQAQDLARLAQRDFSSGLAVAAEQAQPVYLRGKSAWRKSG